MKSTLLIIALLLISAFAVEKRQDSDAATESTVASRGAADLLIEHLDSIETSIRFEQSEHDRLYNSQHSECESEIKVRTTAVVDGEDALRRATSHHVRCESSLQEATADIALVKANIADIASTVQGLTMNREREKQEFKSLIEDELDPAIKAVQGAYPIIDELAAQNSGNSFLQVSKYMSKTFKTLVRAGHGSMMAAPLTLLATLGQDFTEEEIKKVRDLFIELENDLIKAKDEAIQTESDRETLYQATVKEYSDLTEKLTQTQSELVQYEADMQSCVTQEQAIIDSAKSKILNNKNALTYAVQMCGAFEEEYNNASEGRKAELELLGKLKAFIKEQADIFGDYGTEGNNAFETYKSDYESKLKDQVQAFIQMRTKKTQEHRVRMNKALSTQKTKKSLRRN